MSPEKPADTPSPNQPTPDVGTNTPSEKPLPKDLRCLSPEEYEAKRRKILSAGVKPVSERERRKAAKRLAATQKRRKKADVHLPADVRPCGCGTLVPIGASNCKGCGRSHEHRTPRKASKREIREAEKRLHTHKEDRPLEVREGVPVSRHPLVGGEVDRGLEEIEDRKRRPGVRWPGRPRYPVGPWKPRKIHYGS